MNIFTHFALFCSLIACSKNSALDGGSRIKSGSSPSNSAIGKSQLDENGQVRDPGGRVIGSGEPSGSGIGGDVQSNPSGSIGSILGGCKSASLSATTFSKSFPATKGQCNWSAGKKAGALMGHLEQNLVFDIPSSWVICNLEVKSSKSNFYYDDKIVMTVNDRLLWGSSGIFELLNSNRDSLGLIKYNWGQLVGKKASDKISCIEGSTACTGPGTQENGSMGVSLSEATNQKIIQMLLQENRLQFQLIITGDDNPDIDCGHTGLPINVGLQYYVK